MPKSHKAIYAIYVFIWIMMAIHPRFTQDWLLENVLVFLLFPLVIWLDRRFSFSLTSLIMLLVFGSLHALGAHYTYAKMEYFDIVTEFFGFERNHYDRLVHFLYGLLLFRPIFEIITFYISTFRTALLFAFSLIVSISTLYEILEWLAAIIFHPELGIAFLGTQGDVWDSQKDILAAIIGTLVNVIFFYQGYKSLFRNIKIKKS